MPKSSIAYLTGTMHDGYRILEKEWATNTTFSRCSKSLIHHRSASERGETDEPRRCDM